MTFSIQITHKELLKIDVEVTIRNADFINKKICLFFVSMRTVNYQVPKFMFLICVLTKMYSCATYNAKPSQPLIMWLSDLASHLFLAPAGYDVA